MRTKRFVGFILLVLCCLSLIIPGVTGPPIEATGDEVRVTLTVDPFRIDVSGPAELEDLDENRVRLTSDSGNVTISLESGEAIYGLTERIVDDREAGESEPKAVGSLDRRGEKVTMWVTPTISAYVPFYMSSRGYGMLVEGTRPGVYDIGKTDPDELRLHWDVDEDGFSCVFIKGPGYTDILDRYTEMTGRPVDVPKWMCRPLKWRDQVARFRFADLDGLKINAEVADDILHYEKLDFPKGTYMIDRPWAEGKMGYGNFKWDPLRFPNGDQMVTKLHERGWRVIVWGAPWAIGHGPHAFGPEARKKGYVFGPRNLDYTNPAARRWHKNKIEKFLRRSGVDGWKLDRSEETNPSEKSDIYHDGRTGFEVHNDYPRLYIKTYYEATRAVRGDDFVLMPRATYTGTQAYSIVWGGDTKGSVKRLGLIPESTDKGLRSVIISLQRMAFMGFPFWGSDTGGYQRFCDRDVFARWLQVSCFCPLMEIGGKGSHRPWDMPTSPSHDKEMIDIFYRYTWLHTRLV
ncbi:MAG: glycoside hydrolase family 31 protein, partial [bacterium]